MKDVGDREILKTYLNSVSKNTPETDILPHGTESLLTSVIIKFSRQLTGGPGCSTAVIFNRDVLSLSFLYLSTCELLTVMMKFMSIIV